MLPWKQTCPAQAIFATPSLRRRCQARQERDFAKPVGCCWRRSEDSEAMGGCLTRLATQHGCETDYSTINWLWGQVKVASLWNVRKKMLAFPFNRQGRMPAWVLWNGYSHRKFDSFSRDCWSAGWGEIQTWSLWLDERHLGRPSVSLPLVTGDCHFLLLRGNRCSFLGGAP